MATFNPTSIGNYNDTAGVRRRGRISEAVEKFSVIKALQAIEACHVVILVLDAQQEISDQDVTLLGFILESGRALILAINSRGEKGLTT